LRSGHTSALTICAKTIFDLVPQVVEIFRPIDYRRLADVEDSLEVSEALRRHDQWEGVQVECPLPSEFTHAEWARPVRRRDDLNHEGGVRQLPLDVFYEGLPLRDSDSVDGSFAAVGGVEGIEHADISAGELGDVAGDQDQTPRPGRGG
jgi:hypothetical protein